MTYYQACWTLIAVIIAVSIHIDPVVSFIFTHPVEFLKRLSFGLFYYLVTTPKLVFWWTINYPMSSIQFYSWLMQKYAEVYPETLDQEFEDDDTDLE